jgi:hypothetical protein
MLRSVLHENTASDVIRRTLLLRVGDRCNELRRYESERVLRAQPFIATARIRVVPAGRDSVRLEVTAEDELALTLSANVGGGHLQRLRLGTSNFRGAAISVTGSYRYGGVYREGVGVGFTNYQAFGRPWILNLEAIRDPIGSSWGAHLREPFLTDLRPRTGYVGIVRRHGYHSFRDISGPDVSMDVERTEWLAGAAWRIGSAGRSVFAGPLAAGERARADGTPVIVTDSGVIPYSGNGVVTAESEYTSVRGGGLFGLRRFKYVTVSGFDALMGRQDLQSGIEIIGLAARSFRVTGDLERDLLVGGSVYAGTATTRSLLAARLEGESRRIRGTGDWKGTIISGRAAWYSQPRIGRLETVSAEYSGAWDPRIPMQVTLGQAHAGIRGFADSRAGGGKRLVIRAEERRASLTTWRRLDLGAAAFAEAGRLWAGQAPFGVTTSWQFSIGASLLAATPPGSRRLWRLDFAVPLTRAGRPGNYEIRASVGERTREFWREPGDVNRSREGSLLARVLGT